MMMYLNKYKKLKKNVSCQFPVRTYFQQGVKQSVEVKIRTITGKCQVNGVPFVFSLDVTDLTKWEEKVERKAYSIVEDYLNGKSLSSLEYAPVPTQEPDPNRYESGEHYCDICRRHFIGAFQWKEHYKSKIHRRTLYNRKVKELQLKMARINTVLKSNEEKTEENRSCV